VTFDPAFRLYRDDPQDRPSPDIAFWDALAIEVAAELADRRSLYPSLVAKGRLSRVDADRELRVWTAIVEDVTGRPRPDGWRPSATWTEMVHALRREIGLRRTLYPRWIDARRVDAATAWRKLDLVERWHDILWTDCGHAEARTARAAVAAILAARAGDRHRTGPDRARAA
jgi:hypothetical protein